MKKYPITAIAAFLLFACACAPQGFAVHDAHSMYEEQSRIYQDPYIKPGHCCPQCKDGCICKDGCACGPGCSCNERMDDEFFPQQQRKHIRLWRGTGSGND
jgi:hypothetical protein